MNAVEQNFEHPAKVARLRGETLEMHPLARSSDVTVWVGDLMIADSGESHPIYEGLLAQSMGSDSATIAAIPIIVPALRLGDVVQVRTDPTSGALIVVDLLEKSPNATFRVVARHSTDGWLQIQRALEHHDCWFDVYNESILGIAIARSDADELEKILRGLDHELDFDVERTDVRPA